MNTTGEQIFCSSVPLIVRNGSQSGITTQLPGSQMNIPIIDRSGRKVDTILIEISFPSVGMNGRRNLEVRLTDRNDPLFVWQCSLSEEEFYGLKREQNLLVDFHQFPFKIVELLRQCISHSNQESPTFSAILQISPEEVLTSKNAHAILTIAESTSLRQITHLSLRLSAPSEGQMRKYFADIVRRYQEELDSLRMRQYPAPIYDCPPLAASNPSYNVPYNLNDQLRALESQNQLLLAQKKSLENEIQELRRSAGGVAAYPTIPSTKPYPSQPNVNNNYSTIQTDLNKANEIIRKLQDEVKSLRTRCRSAETSARQMEKLMKDTQSSSNNLRTEVNELREQISTKSALLSTVQGEKIKLEAELEDAKKLVEANEKVIEWLHQQINDDQIQRILSKHETNDAGSSARYSSLGKRPSPELANYAKEKERYAAATVASTSSSSPGNY